MEGVHPCTYVTEDVNVCILDEGDEPNDDNCWNMQNCKNPFQKPSDLFNEHSEDDVVTAGSLVNTAFVALLSIACLIL